MKKNRKNVSLLSTLLASIVFFSAIMLFSGCGSSNKLADCFDESTVKKQAQDDITIAESDDFEGWLARFSPDLQSAVTEAAYTSYLDTLKEKGAFTEFGKTAVIGQEQNVTNYAVAIVICKHEKGDIKYTIAYDENMNLIQFTI